MQDALPGPTATRGWTAQVLDWRGLIAEADLGGEPVGKPSFWGAKYQLIENKGPPESHER